MSRHKDLPAQFTPTPPNYKNVGYKEEAEKHGSV